MGYEVASLGSLITEYVNQKGSLEDLQRAFSSFHCEKNEDEEDFLRQILIKLKISQKSGRIVLTN